MLSTLSDRGVQRLNAKLQVNDNGEMNTEKFYSMLYDEAKKSGLTENTLSSIRMGLSMDNFSDRKWIYQKLISKIDKHVLSFEMPGNQLILVSGYGFSSNQFKTSNDLKFIFDENNKVKGIEAKVSVQVFKDVIPDYYNETIEQKRKWLRDNEGLLEGLAYRIPTQGQNSVISIIVKDFLPEEAGDCIMLPNEITTQTGSDFDIDKAFFNSFNYRKTVESGNEKVSKIKYSSNPKDAKNRYEAMINTSFNRFSYLFSPELYDKIKNIKSQKYQSYKNNFDFHNDNGETISDLIHQRKPLYDLISSGDQKAKDYYNHKLEDLDSKIDDILYNHGIEHELEKFGEYQDEIKKELIKNKVLPEFEDFIKLPIIEQNSEKAIQNHLLEHYRSIVLSDNNFIQSTTPLDQLTKPFKDLSEKVRIAESKENKSGVKDLRALSPVYQSNIKYKNAQGKQGVGSSALNLTSHSMCQGAEISHKKYFNIGHESKEKGTSLYEVYSKPDTEGNKTLISDNLSAIVSLSVDVAKGETSLMDLNIVKRTWGVLNFCLRSGEVSNKVLSFLPQPILKDLSRRSINGSGKVGRFRNYSEWDKNVVINQEIIADWNKKYNDALERDKKTGSEVDTKLKNYDPFEDDMLSLIETDPKDRDAIWYRKQLKILDRFLDIDNGPGRDLNSLTLSTRVDVNKGGNPTEIKLQRRNVQKLIKSDKFNNITKLISLSETDHAETSFLSAYGQNFMNTVDKLLRNQTLTATDGFNLLMFKMLKSLGKDGSVKEEELNNFSDEIYSSIIGKFFKEECGLTSNNILAVCKEVVSILNEVKRGTSKYNHLNDNKLISNLSLRLRSDKESSFPGFTGISLSKSEDKSVTDEYTYEWQKLLSDKDPDVRRLGKDLLLFSFYTSGFNQKIVYALSNFIPAKLRMEFETNTGKHNLDKFIKDTIIKLNSKDKFTVLSGLDDDIFQNNYNDPLYVKQLGYKDVSGDSVVRTKDGKDIVMLTTIPKRGQSKDAPYIHYKHEYEDDKSYLMKLVGKTSTGDPIYATVQKKGYKNKAMSVKEYGLDDSILTINKTRVLEDHEISSILSKDPRYKGSELVKPDENIDDPNYDNVCPTINDDTIGDISIPPEGRSLSGEPENAQFRDYSRIDKETMNKEFQDYKSSIREDIKGDKELIEMLDNAETEKEVDEIMKKYCEEGISTSSVDQDINMEVNKITKNNKNKYSAKDEL